MAENKFRGKQVIDFIRKYKDCECLWNIKSNIYKRLDLKQKCYEELSKQFKMTVAEIKKKIKSLRGTYIAERRKVLEYKPSGSEAISPYEPNLAWYYEMAFLDSVIVFRKSTNNIVQVSSQRVFISIILNSSYQNTCRQFRTTQRRF